MLLQSHAGEIHLLPALPAAWSDGAFRGLRARGAIHIDLAWSGGKATRATLHPQVAGTHRLRAPRGQQVAGMTSGGKKVALRREGDVVTVTLAAGRKIGRASCRERVEISVGDV